MQLRKGLILAYRLRVWPVSHGGQECETASHIASTGRMQTGTLAHGIHHAHLERNLNQTSGNTFSTPRGMFSWDLSLVKLTRFINHHSKLTAHIGCKLHSLPLLLGADCFVLKQAAWHCRPQCGCSLCVPWERSRVEAKWPRPAMLTSQPPASLIHTRAERDRRKGSWSRGACSP